jgi:hypothetical protein
MHFKGGGKGAPLWDGPNTSASVADWLACVGDGNQAQHQMMEMQHQMMEQQMHRAPPPGMMGASR